MATERAFRARVLMTAYERAARVELGIIKWTFNRKSGVEANKLFPTWAAVAAALDEHEIDYYDYCAWWMAFWLKSRDTRKVRSVAPPPGMLGGIKAINRFKGQGASSTGSLQTQDAEFWLADSKATLLDLKHATRLPAREIVVSMWTALPAEFLAVCEAFHAAARDGRINLSLNPSHAASGRRYYREFTARGVYSFLCVRVAAMIQEIDLG